MKISLLILTIVFIGVTYGKDHQFEVYSAWGTGFSASFTLNPDHDLHGWKVRLIFDKPIDSIEIWTGKVIETSSDNTEYVIKNKPYDAIVKAGHNLTVAFNGKMSGGDEPTATVILETTHPTSPMPTKSTTGSLITAGHSSTDSVPSVVTDVSRTSIQGVTSSGSSVNSGSVGAANTSKAPSKPLASSPGKSNPFGK